MINILHKKSVVVTLLILQGGGALGPQLQSKFPNFEKLKTNLYAKCHILNYILNILSSVCIGPTSFWLSPVPFQNNSACITGNISDLCGTNTVNEE